MDEKGYILEYRDFNPKHKDEIDKYVWKHITNEAAVKIHIRKW
jgi:hypothetical protein